MTRLLLCILLFLSIDLWSWLLLLSLYLIWLWYCLFHSYWSLPFCNCRPTSYLLFACDTAFGSCLSLSHFQYIFSSTSIIIPSSYSLQTQSINCNKTVGVNEIFPSRYLLSAILADRTARSIESSSWPSSSSPLTLGEEVARASEKLRQELRSGVKMLFCLLDGWRNLGRSGVSNSGVTRLYFDGRGSFCGIEVFLAVCLSIVAVGGETCLCRKAVDVTCLCLTSFVSQSEPNLTLEVTLDTRLGGPMDPCLSLFASTASFILWSFLCRAASSRALLSASWALSCSMLIAIVE